MNIFEIICEVRYTNQPLPMFIIAGSHLAGGRCAGSAGRKHVAIDRTSSTLLAKLLADHTAPLARRSSTSSKYFLKSTPRGPNATASWG